MDHAITLGMKKVVSWSDPKILKNQKNIMAQIIWFRGRPVYFLKDVPLILQDIQ